MARTASKNAIKTIETKLNSKKQPKRKNNLKEIKKETTLKEKTVESIIEDINNVSLSVDVPAKKSSSRSSTTKKGTTAKSTTSKTTGKSTAVKKSATKSTADKKGTTAKSTSNKKSTTKNSTSGTRGRKKKEPVENKFDVLDDIISDLDKTDKFKFDDNGINDTEKQVISDEFEEDILSDKKFDLVDLKPSDNDNVTETTSDISKNDDNTNIETVDSNKKEDTTIEEFTLDNSNLNNDNNASESKLVNNIETTPVKKRGRKKRVDRFAMIENPLDDTVDNSSRDDLFDNIDKESSDEVVSSFEEDLGLNEKTELDDKIDDYKYDDLEDDLRTLYDVGNDVVESIHKNQEQSKPKFTREKKVKIKKKREIKEDNEVTNYEENIKPSILDFISQKALNFFLGFFFIIFLLMCIAFVIFVIFVSTF